MLKSLFVFILFTKKSLVIVCLAFKVLPCFYIEPTVYPLLELKLVILLLKISDFEPLNLGYGSSYYYNPTKLLGVDFPEGGWF